MGKETNRLEKLEGIIRGKRSAFYEIGEALREIRDGKLYREPAGFKTFDDYCRERWSMDRTHAYRAIEAFDIRETLSPIGDILPVSESQSRPLRVLEPEQQIEAWNEVIERADGGAITAKLVAEVVAVVRGDTSAKPEWNLVRATVALERSLVEFVRKWPRDEVESMREFLSEWIEELPDTWTATRTPREYAAALEAHDGTD